MAILSAEYLSLPEEVLVTVMRDHQKYFAVEDANGKLAPHFLAVLNTKADDEGQAIIRHGNARVLRARFKDARFFWDFDQKVPLAERVESLKNVTFQKELGIYHWKTEENLESASLLSEVAAKAGVQHDSAALMTAVRLAKTDLTTELVKEFTELQGVVGGLYARAQGLGEHVALAIYEQYTPASTEDDDSGFGRGAAAGAGRSHPDDRGDVRDRIAADRIEGSVCAASCGECDCEDSGGVGLAAEVERCGALCVDG